MGDRPNLTDARVTAGTTYRRRRARSAADMLLEIPPADWDDHTRRVILVTLPALAFARELARYGEPAIPHEENFTEDAQGFTACHSGVCGACDACRTGADDPLQAPPPSAVPRLVEYDADHPADRDAAAVYFGAHDNGDYHA